MSYIGTFLWHPRGTLDIHEATKNVRKIRGRKCRTMSLADVTWKNMELPQTLSSAVTIVFLAACYCLYSLIEKS